MIWDTHLIIWYIIRSEYKEWGESNLYSYDLGYSPYDQVHKNEVSTEYEDWGAGVCTKSQFFPLFAIHFRYSLLC